MAFAYSATLNEAFGDGKEHGSKMDLSPKPKTTFEAYNGPDADHWNSNIDFSKNVLCKSVIGLK